MLKLPASPPHLAQASLGIHPGAPWVIDKYSTKLAASLALTPILELVDYSDDYLDIPSLSSRIRSILPTIFLLESSHSHSIVHQDSDS